MVFASAIASLTVVDRGKLPREFHFAARCVQRLRRGLYPLRHFDNCRRSTAHALAVASGKLRQFRRRRQQSPDANPHAAAGSTIADAWPAQAPPRQRKRSRYRTINPVGNIGLLDVRAAAHCSAFLLFHTRPLAKCSSRFSSADARSPVRPNRPSPGAVTAVKGAEEVCTPAQPYPWCENFREMPSGNGDQQQGGVCTGPVPAIVRYGMPQLRHRRTARTRVIIRTRLTSRNDARALFSASATPAESQRGATFAGPLPAQKASTCNFSQLRSAEQRRRASTAGRW